MRFPSPIPIGPCSVRWRLSDLEAYEAACAGVEPPPARSSEDERYLHVRTVADRYSSTPSTIWRWCRPSVEEVVG